MRKQLFGILYGFFLFAFTAYVLLDTFVITRVYEAVSPSDPSKTEDLGEMGSQSTESKDAIENPATRDQIVQTDSSYSDGNISITISEHRVKETTIYVAEVKLSSPEYLKTALANGSYGKNVTQKTSEMSEDNQAILAINGDYYGAREKGYVVRNGVVYRTKGSSDQEALVIYEDGSFEVVTENTVSAEALAEQGAVQILSFGPALVLDGEISVTEDEEVGKAKSSNPRTAIGLVDPLHYYFVVSDGRTDESAGLSLHELADFMKSLGVTLAYNLDGGGSSTMYFNGKVVNNPTSDGKRIKERSVSDIVYIGY